MSAFAPFLSASGMPMANAGPALSNQPLNALIGSLLATNSCTPLAGIPTVIVDARPPGAPATCIRVDSDVHQTVPRVPAGNDDEVTVGI